MQIYTNLHKNGGDQVRWLGTVSALKTEKTGHSLLLDATDDQVPIGILLIYKSQHYIDTQKVPTNRNILHVYY